MQTWVRASKLGLWIFSLFLRLYWPHVSRAAASPQYRRPLQRVRRKHSRPRGVCSLPTDSSQVSPLRRIQALSAIRGVPWPPLPPYDPKARAHGRRADGMMAPRFKGKPSFDFSVLCRLCGYKIQPHELVRVASHIIQCPGCGGQFDEMAGKKPLSTSIQVSTELVGKDHPLKPS